MEFQHIWGVAIRHFRLLWYDPNRLMSTLYWPLLDILIWGFLGSWLQSGHQEVPGLAGVFLLGVLLWQVVVRMGVRIGTALLEELWTNNIVNLFASPLRLREWLAGVILFAVLLVCFSALYGLGLIWLLNPVSVSRIGLNFLLFSPPLFISGIWLGLITLCLIISFGKGAQELIFIIGWAFAPFSAVYYPREALPLWAQKISLFLPMSYIFEGMREYTLFGTSPVISLWIAYTLSSVYASATLLYFIYLFGKSKEKGLARLHD